MSLAGDSLPLRLRSVTIGIVGLVAATGLGLVGMIYQQDWPQMLGVPLPEHPGSALVRNDTIALQPTVDLSADRSDPGPASTATASLPTVATPTESRTLDSSPEPASSPDATDQPAAPSPPRPDGEKPSVPAPATATPPVPNVEAPPSPAVEMPPPAAPEVEDDSPGNSGQAPGHTTGHGPPPWASPGKADAADASGGHGKPSWAGH